MGCFFRCFLEKDEANCARDDELPSFWLIRDCLSRWYLQMKHCDDGCRQIGHWIMTTRWLMVFIGESSVELYRYSLRCAKSAHHLDGILSLSGCLCSVMAKKLAINMPSACDGLVEVIDFAAKELRIKEKLHASRPCGVLKTPPVNTIRL